MPNLKYFDTASGIYLNAADTGPEGPAGPDGPVGPAAQKAEVSTAAGTPTGAEELWASAGTVRYLSAPGTWTVPADFGGQTITRAGRASATTDAITKQGVDALKQYDSGWTAVTLFMNGWSNYEYGWPPLRYRRTNEGVVHVSGLIKGGTNNVICQLPVGFRPARGALIFMQMCNPNKQARVDVRTDGQILCGWLQGDNGWLSIHLSFYAAPVQPGPAAPTNFRATNIGSSTNSVALAWDARSGATSYKIYYQYGTSGNIYHGSTTGLTYTIGGMGNDTNYSFYIEAVDGNGNVSTTMGGPVKVRSGHPASSIPAGTGYVSGGVQSMNRWRQNQWGYGGSSQPYIGWYSTEGYRYAAFYELSGAYLRQVMVNAYPQLNGHHQSVTCTGAGIFFARDGSVGNYNNEYTVQVSLANGISYANGAEPGAQAYVSDIVVKTVGAGQVRYSMTPNWFQAIYQDHASYNGLLFRPYRNDGGRQQYMAFSSGGAIFDMSFSWPTIITGTATNTSAW